jgi:tartrate-resistant acid phosphatase type 5
MDGAAKALNASFALGIGDNFYDDGVTSINDPRFMNTFENVFKGAHLQAPFRFQFVAGNHDHNGNVSAEVAYSAVSPRWVFPDLYYTFTETADDGATIQFVMIDTVILAGNSDVDGITLDGDVLPGPEDAVLAQSQLQWIEATMKASTADYLIVVGHYPVYSICEHGPTSLLVIALKPLLEQFGAHYFNGHDHCAEMIEVNDVHYHTIGAAHSVDSSTAHASAIPSGSLKFHWTTPDTSSIGAFATVSVNKQRVLVHHVSGTGQALYTDTISPRSQQ